MKLPNSTIGFTFIIFCWTLLQGIGAEALKYNNLCFWSALKISLMPSHLEWMIASI